MPPSNDLHAALPQTQPQPQPQHHPATAPDAMRECDALWRQIQAQIARHVSGDGDKDTDLASIKTLGLIIANLKRVQDGRRQALLLAGSSSASDGGLHPALVEALRRIDALVKDDEVNGYDE